MPKEKPRFLVDQEGQAQDASSGGTQDHDKSQGPNIYRDLGIKSDSGTGPTQGTVDGSPASNVSPNLPSRPPRFSPTSLVLPAIVLTIFVIYQGGFVRSYPFLHKTLYSVILSTPITPFLFRGSRLHKCHQQKIRGMDSRFKRKGTKG